MIDRRSLILGSLFMAGAAARAAVAIGPRRVAAARPPLAGTLPHQIGDRSIALAEAPVLPQRDATIDRIYDDFIVRSYRGPGLAPITMLIAYGSNQDGGLELHRPENCYPPYGYVLDGLQPVRLTLPSGHKIMATIATATRNGISDQLLFWTRIGPDFPTSRWETDMSIARAALRGEIPDGVLVRMSMRTTQPEQATLILAAFARDLVRSAPDVVRRMLVGDD
jgi:EpsI family protein